MRVYVYDREMIQYTERMVYCLKVCKSNVGRVGNGLVQEESDLIVD